ncbi:hypothetical protein CAPTEDRAFT_163591 [Capitella teleta]|uniref:PDZ and LIM domain protein Zasp n=1 Tax=Capitella teleta TaxID=283909 RepID=R7UEP6_CAPTE|nr:hypothetical protein CAPTEDRAFT_163591 [Capitella teleta]|eukprot:ELU02263.1 hypothetical protein CAPTEDRAFT_163591 [Capitella teleta]
MTTLSLSARLDRTDSSTPWGFRMHGGKDFGCPLSIQKVNPNSLAQQCGLQTGDAIVKIGDSPTDGMMHREAQQTIVSCGNHLELALQRGGGRPSATSHVQAPSYPTPAPPQNNYAPQPPQNSFAASAPSSTLPVAVNKQYNTPINMYSVNNVMDTLAHQTSGVNIGISEPSPSVPWQKSSGGSAPPSHVPQTVGVSVGGSAAGKWQPSIPTGPRNMKVGKRGEARNMPAAGGGTRVPMCATCNISIRGPFVSALDKTWCPNHFVCANPQCRQPLIDVGFVEEAGQLFCENDYRMYFAPHCGKCGDAIIGERVSTQIGHYHAQCFVCSHCGGAISEGRYHTQDNKIYCLKDWGQLFQTKCYGCEFPIEPGDRWVEALNENWHSECFNCSTCQQNLEGQSFYAKSGKPFCKKHAGRI